MTHELGRCYIATVDPENIKTILSLNFEDYAISSRLYAFGPLLGESIFDTDGEAWARSRALIRPSFARDQIVDLTSLEILFRDLMELLPRDGTTVVDLQSLFFRYTLDSATEFLFGRSAGTLQGDHSGSQLDDAFDHAKYAIMLRGSLGRLSAIVLGKKADDAFRTCRRFGAQFVDEAVQRANGKVRESQNTSDKRLFLDDLAARTTDKKVILDEVMSLLLAGRDTTAGLLSNLFFMLAKNTGMWDKLRREVASLEGHPPSYEDLQRLKYVQCCVNESLRFHPVVPRNERQAIRNTILPVGGGADGASPVFVPKGAMVAFNIYAMHRRKDIYGLDADVFRPERWEDGNLKPPAFAFLPFHGGARVCLGRQYALTEARYVLVRMVQEFRRLQSEDDGPWVESLAITLSSRGGVKVSLMPE